MTDFSYKQALQAASILVDGKFDKEKVNDALHALGEMSIRSLPTMSPEDSAEHIQDWISLARSALAPSIQHFALREAGNILEVALKQKLQGCPELENIVKQLVHISEQKSFQEPLLELIVQQNIPDRDLENRVTISDVFKLFSSPLVVQFEGQILKGQKTSLAQRAHDILLDVFKDDPLFVHQLTKSRNSGTEYDFMTRANHTLAHRPT